MPCEFCNRKVPLLPGYSGNGEQYHEFVPSIGGFPICAFRFDDKGRKHPFVKPPPFADQTFCDFCKIEKDNEVHNT